MPALHGTNPSVPPRRELSGMEHVRDPTVYGLYTRMALLGPWPVLDRDAPQHPNSGFPTYNTCTNTNEGSVMNTTASTPDLTGPTGVEFTVRPPELPTKYPWTQRFIDAWMGRRDASRLTTAQRGPRPGAGDHQDLTADPPVTPWAIERTSEFIAVKRKEAIIWTQIIDDLRVELVQLESALSALAQDAETSQRDAVTVAAQSPDSAAPRGPGEALARAEDLIGRRSREHLARIAAQQSLAMAAKSSQEGSRKRIAAINERLTLAEKSWANRVDEYEMFVRRRIAVYARGLSRKNPNAPVLASLTYRLDLNAPWVSPEPIDPPRLTIV